MDTSKIYHATASEIEASNARAARRALMKAEYLKKSTNPAGNGYVFDPAMQRFMSMTVSTKDYYKFTPKNAWFPLTAVVLPICSIWYYLQQQHIQREKDFRSGSVPYTERLFKYD